MKTIKIFYLMAISFLSLQTIQAQNKPYGQNDQAGRYVNVGDTNIYYEVYGQGRPIILLHGGLYGYIDEYSEFIPALSQHFKVLAVALRGHGKSEIGTKPITYRLFAEDVVAVLNQESNDSAMVIGFSDGGITAYLMAAEFQDKIRKVVSIGGGFALTGYKPDGLDWLKSFTPEGFRKNNAWFMEERLKLMPQPERLDEFLTKMKAAWTEQVWVSPEKAARIKCPVLTIGGDRDDFFTTEQFVTVYQSIPNSQLAIIPNAGHVESINRPFVFEHIILPFVLK